MAEDQPQTTATPEPPSKPYGPGPLMVFGLACVAAAIYCARDTLYPPDEWVKSGETWKTWMNGIFAAGFALGAIWTLILAAVRAKSPPADSASSPPEPPSQA